MEIPQYIIDNLTRNWVWLLLVLILAIIIIAMRNKAIKHKMHSLFGWPPEP